MSLSCDHVTVMWADFKEEDGITTPFRADEGSEAADPASFVYFTVLGGREPLMVPINYGRLPNKAPVARALQYFAL